MCIIESLPCHRLLSQVLIILCVCTSFVIAQASTQTSIAPSWPTGTEAQGSSVHSDVSGESFDYFHAIDGNLDTKWTDDSIAAYPDSLTISIPTAITLIGIVVVSSENGWLQTYYVETYNGTNWRRMAEISNATSPFQLINFLSPAIARKIRINVTQDQASLKGEYTRIHEVYPLFGTSLSSALNSSSSLCARNLTSTSSTSSTDRSALKKCSNTGAIAGGVVGGVLAIILAALSGFFTFRKRRNKDGSDLSKPHSDLSPEELALGNPYPAANTYKAAGEIELPVYAARPAELCNHATLDSGTVHDMTVSEGHEDPAELPNHISQNIESLHPSTTQHVHDRL